MPDLQTATEALVRSSLAPSGRLRAALNFGNALLASRAADGTPCGVSVDLARAIAERLRLPLEFVHFESAGAVFQALAQHPWDLAFLAIDPQRALQLQFSAPYVRIEGTYLVREGAPFGQVGALDAPGVRIAVTRGSGYELHLTRALVHAELVRVARPEDAFRAFHDQALDALAAVRQPLDRFAAEHGGLRVLSDAFMRIEHAMALPKDRTAAHAWLERFLAEAKAGGWLAQAFHRNGQGDVRIAP